MKQLTYTSCQPGQSPTGESGFQVRAASPGIPPDRLRILSGHAVCRLPAGFTPASPPRRLALLDVTGVGRVLCHGNTSFTHLLLDLPAEVTALQALRWWGSSFWLA